MLNRRTVKIFTGLWAAYALLSLPAWVGPAFLQEISGDIYLTPIFAIYIFHRLGLPGLLEHGGACGWSLCAPTAAGWAFLILFWAGVAWCVAWGLARLTLGSSARAHVGPPSAGR
jgi:hypothetical protein